MISPLLFALSPFVLNAVMGLAKWTSGLGGTAGKRFFLAVFSIIGVVTMSALSGNPLDVNSVSSLTQTALESLIAFLAAHGSYTMFWKKPAPVQ